MKRPNKILAAALFAPLLFAAHCAAFYPAAVPYLVGGSVLSALAWASLVPPTLVAAANAVTIPDVKVTPEGRATRLLDATVAARHLLYKEGVTPGRTVAVNAAANTRPFAVVEDSGAAGGEVTARFLATGIDPVKLTASEAIDAGEPVYAAANGKVQDQPVVAGVYFRVGRARTAALADGDILEVEPCEPVKVVVVAAPTVGAVIADIAGGQSPTEAEHIEATTRINQLRVDLLALNTALAAEPAEVLWLAPA